jgi:hypothetical protein
MAMLSAAVVVGRADLSAQGRTSPPKPAAAPGLQVYKDDLELLKRVRILQCQFDSGFATAVLADGTQKTVPMASLFGTITYDNIDRSAGTAREISDIGGKNVSVIPTEQVLTFMEVTSYGNPVFTSVFSTLRGGMPGVFVAVTSRHVTPDIMTPGAPRILGLAQYYGSCKVPIAP